MVIAFLALLGVDLVVIVFFVGTVVSRKRWVVNRQPGAFKGATRLADGGRSSPRELEAWGPPLDPQRVVWTESPLLFRNELLPADGSSGRPCR